MELAKEQEARTAEAMGYNPYEARLTGNSVRQLSRRDSNWNRFPSAGVVSEHRRGSRRDGKG